ncbi:class I SAM-dependent methyltransferase [Mycobacterium sp. WMMD1722]|uniref:class I SAM-dependent methyltransferase n=1 Tax=Mycobacterium sp. WMMD1722 TaxID=3404117 RepID=UPI003BF4D3F2
MTVEFWEGHYGAAERVWSGRVNARLAEIAENLTPGTALDVGCGEGADAIWLAQRGWRVVGVDVSPTALRRAAEDAAAAGVAERISFQRHDLTADIPAGRFDLVSAQFFHAPYEWDREAILRRLAESVAAGGRLLVVDHASAPPGMADDHHHDFPSAHEVVEKLALDPACWERVRVEAVERDSVILLRRSDEAR